MIIGDERGRADASKIVADKVTVHMIRMRPDIAEYNPENKRKSLML